MELKTAVAVCLISLFSATLVVLIARTLDSQAAVRLEPQLAQIAEELQAIRKQGGIATAPTAGAASDATENGLVVYYFHGTVRCPTCEAIEAQAHATVTKDFAAQLADGGIVWKVLNYEQPANATFVKKFDILAPIVVLAKMQGGQIADWRRLDEVWVLVNDKPAFAKYVHEQIAQMLAPAASPADAATKPAAPPAAETKPALPAGNTTKPATPDDAPPALPPAKPPAIPVPM